MCTDASLPVQMGETKTEVNSSEPPAAPETEPVYDTFPPVSVNRTVLQSDGDSMGNSPEVLNCSEETTGSATSPIPLRNVNLPAHYPKPDAKLIELVLARRKAQRKYRKNRTPANKTIFNRISSAVRRRVDALSRKQGLKPPRIRKNKRKAPSDDTGTNNTPPYLEAEHEAVCSERSPKALVDASCVDSLEETANERVILEASDDTNKVHCLDKPIVPAQVTVMDGALQNNPGP